MQRGRRLFRYRNSAGLLARVECSYGLAAALPYARSTLATLR